MASIRPHVGTSGETTYSVLYRDNGRQRSQTFATRKKAEDFRTLVGILGAARAVAELNADETHGLTVDELAERFFDHKAGDVTPRTLDDYRRDYNNWIRPTLGHRRADTVDERDIQQWVDGMNRRLDPKSVRDRHMLISSMYKWGSARTRLLVNHNPCGETQLPKRKRKPIRGMTIPEWHAFYATAQAADPDVADMALFLVTTGWRWSEAAALTWAHVDDLGGGMLAATVGQVVRRRPGEVGAIAEDAKNETSLRSSLLGGLAAEMLERRRRQECNGTVTLLPIDAYVFTNPHGRRWHQGNFLARHWAPIALAVFGPDRKLTPHSLRHSHALLLDRAGASMPQMARRLGHANIDTTVDVYGGLIGDVSPLILSRIDAMLTPHDADPLELG